MKKNTLIYLCAVYFIATITISRKNDKFPIEPIPAIVSFQNDVQPIFNSDCIVCHNETGFIAPSNFKEGVSYDEIISKLLVIPNNLEASNMYQRLVGNISLMPPCSPIPQSKIDIIGEWILQGAINN